MEWRDDWREQLSKAYADAVSSHLVGDEARMRLSIVDASSLFTDGCLHYLFFDRRVAVRAPIPDFPKFLEANARELGFDSSVIAEARSLNRLRNEVVHTRAGARRGMAYTFLEFVGGRLSVFGVETREALERLRADRSATATISTSGSSTDIVRNILSSTGRRLDIEERMQEDSEREAFSRSSPFDRKAFDAARRELRIGLRAARIHGLKSIRTETNRDLRREHLDVTFAENLMASSEYDELREILDNLPLANSVLDALLEEEQILSRRDLSIL